MYYSDIWFDVPVQEPGATLVVPRKVFRNLLLGENNELKNRYMLIGYKDDENDTHTSTHTSSIEIQPSSENVTRLV